MKLNKVSRLLFSVAALLLGTVLQNVTGEPLFFLLGVALCVFLFGFAGRGGEFRARREQKKK